MRLQIEGEILRVKDADFGVDLTIGLTWAQKQWVYTYLFSDESNNKRGYGVYVRGHGA